MSGEKFVDLAWAMERGLVICSRGDWWWREFLLCKHFTDALSVGFVCDNRFAYALYFGTEVLLYHPTIEQTEAILTILQQNREAESNRAPSGGDNERL